MRDLVDINSNGVLGLPDLLAWFFFATVGLFGATVCAGLAVGALTALARGSWAALRRGRELLHGSNERLINARDH